MRCSRAKTLTRLSLAAAASALVFGGFVFWIADAFGFLFWEMKENWGLYRANRRATCVILSTPSPTVCAASSSAT